MTRTRLNRILTVDGQEYRIFPFAGLGSAAATESLPFCLKILLENLLRHRAEDFVTDDDIEALLHWDPQAEPAQGDRVRAGACAVAGLYRCAGHC